MWMHIALLLKGCLVQMSRLLGDFDHGYGVQFLRGRWTLSRVRVELQQSWFPWRKIARSPFPTYVHVKNIFHNEHKLAPWSSFQTGDVIFCGVSEWAVWRPTQHNICHFGGRILCRGRGQNVCVTHSMRVTWQAWCWYCICVYNVKPITLLTDITIFGSCLSCMFCYIVQDVLQRHPLHTIAQLVSYTDAFSKSNVVLKIGQVGRRVFDCYVFQCQSAVIGFNFPFYQRSTCMPLFFLYCLRIFFHGGQIIIFVFVDCLLLVI